MDMLDRIRPSTTETERIPQAVGVSTDAMLEALATPRRRETIRLLDGEGRESDRRDLAVAMAAGENDKAPRHVNHDERKRTYVTLYQLHLPSLDDIDVIDYDGRSGDVVAGPNFDAALWLVNQTGRVTDGGR